MILKIKRTINPLFEQWKTEMAERSFSRYMDAPPFPIPGFTG
jgi:hypothetical protein